MSSNRGDECSRKCWRLWWVIISNKIIMLLLAPLCRFPSNFRWEQVHNGWCTSMTFSEWVLCFLAEGDTDTAHSLLTKKGERAGAGGLVTVLRTSLHDLDLDPDPTRSSGSPVSASFSPDAIDQRALSRLKTNEAHGTAQHRTAEFEQIRRYTCYAPNLLSAGLDCLPKISSTRVQRLDARLVYAYHLSGYV